MEELLKLLLLFVVGSVAGFINVMAGGRILWRIYTSWRWIPAHGIALPSDETLPCPCQYAQDIYRIYLYYSGPAYLCSYPQCGFQVWFYLGSRKCTWGIVVRKVFC